MTVISSAAGWLVWVVSLLSSTTDVAPVPAISMPKLVLGLANHPFTCAVTSTSRNAFAVLAGMEEKGAPTAGAVL
jgi:hypothetical protein